MKIDTVPSYYERAARDIEILAREMAEASEGLTEDLDHSESLKVFTFAEYLFGNAENFQCRARFIEELSELPAYKKAEDLDSELIRFCVSYLIGFSHDLKDWINPSGPYKNQFWQRDESLGLRNDVVALAGRLKNQAQHICC